MIAKQKSQPRRSVVAALVFAALGITTLTDGCSRAPSDGAQTSASTPAEPLDLSAPPRVVSTTPSVGATDVDPKLQEITVTFDRDMGAGMSWTGGGSEFPRVPSGQQAHWKDPRTCVLPVKLDPGHYYRVGINSTSHRNFESVQRVAAQPSAIYFTTTGATQSLMDRTAKPQIVSLNPPNGARDVDPNLQELRVTFNVPMGAGMSWTGGGAQFPAGIEGSQPQWTNGGKTCVLPVRLEPAHEYRLGLNSPSHKNFQSAAGVPLDAVVYTFKTR